MRRLIFCLLFISQIAWGATCNQEISPFLKVNIKISLEQIVQYQEEITEAATTLKMKEMEFLARLEKADLSLEDFFKQVEAYKLEGKKLGPREAIKKVMETCEITLSKEFKEAKAILNSSKSDAKKFTALLKFALSLPAHKSKQLMTELFQGLKRRVLVTPNLYLTLGTSLSLNTSTMGLSHYLSSGATHLNELTSNLAAFSVLEVYLTLASTKDAAYLVANPKIIEAGTRLKNSMSPDDLQISKSFASKLASFSKNLSLGATRTVTSTVKQIPANFITPFTLSLLPVGIGASMASHEASEIISRTMFDSFLIATFFSLWSKLRYEALYNEVFPLISRNFDDSPYLQKGALMGLTVGNIAVGSFTYTWWYNFAHRKKDEFSLQLDSSKH